MIDFFTSNTFLTVVAALNTGFLKTLQLFFITLIGALPLGLIISFGSMSRWAPLARPVYWQLRRAGRGPGKGDREMGVLDGLEPREVFHWFEELSAIPRGSGNTRAVSDWCAAFGRERGLECHQDGLGNVILIKPATPGYEGAAHQSLTARVFPEPRGVPL